LEGSTKSEVTSGHPEFDPPEPRTAVARIAQAEPAPGARTVSARGALELVGLVVAPTTLVTALAFYFGWVLTYSRASYFGIDSSALGFSTQDYVLRSADALFVPLGAAIVLALGIVWLHGNVTRQLGDRGRRRRLRVAARAAVVAGAVLFALGIISVFEPLSFSPHYLFPSASPGIGIALLAYALHLLGRIDAAEQPRIPPAADNRNRVAVMLVALLIVLSAFWTASTYADALGRGRAARLAAALSARPHVTVFAPKRLSIDAGGVTERRLTGDDLAYRYRYSGLRLLIRSGGKYFLLPDRWTRSSGAAIVLADSPDYRFEFGAGRR
jgi:hypothetical protein